jgi:CHAD domain-containing protein
MNCLDQYRSKLLSGTNRELRIIIGTPDESSIHRFRVSVKRLTALYRFLAAIDPKINAKQILRPARKLSKCISEIRDVHITLNLFAELDGLDTKEVQTLQRALNVRIQQDYQSFRNLADSDIQIPLRLPTAHSLGLAESTILRSKPEILRQLRDDFCDGPQRLNARQWHKKRILMKRYHHSLDAFSNCPGHTLDEKELAQMKMLEKLLGDWHDRLVAVEILKSFPNLQAQTTAAIVQLKKQERLLLGACRIYREKFILWQANRLALT